DRDHVPLLDVSPEQFRLDQAGEKRSGFGAILGTCGVLFLLGFGLWAVGFTYYMPVGDIFNSVLLVAAGMGLTAGVLLGAILRIDRASAAHPFLFGLLLLAVFTVLSTSVAAGALLVVNGGLDRSDPQVHTVTV